MVRRITFDYNYNEFSGPILYRMDYYESDSSKVVPWNSPQDRHVPRKVFTLTLAYDGNRFGVVEHKMLIPREKDGQAKKQDK